MNKNVFVYGSLMFPQVAVPIAGLCGDCRAACLHGYARYSVDDRSRAKVPAIVEEPGARVRGKVYLDVGAQSLRELDNFEDMASGQYERREVEVELESGETLRAEVYVAGPRASKSLSGEWSPEDFEKNDLQYYVEKVVPRYTSGDRALDKD